MLFDFVKIGAQGDGGTLFLPKQASTLAANQDALFYFIYYLCLFFFVLIVGLMIVFVVRGRYKGDGSPVKTSGVKGNHTLEVVWSVIPGILMVIIFGWGFKDWVKTVVTPANAIDVRVTGLKWAWSFDYVASGVNSNRLVVPQGQPVRLTMSSKDVIHSFYVPAFRVKRDVLPGRYTVMWFEATELGEYSVQCTEYCGTSHSGMLSTVKVVPQEEYEQWIADGGDLGGSGIPPAELGAKLYEAKGCNACHSLDGSAKIGPSFKGLYERNGEFTDGKSYVADDTYIRQSILEPQAHVVKGYQPVMPSYQGQLNDKQIAAIIDYMKTLK